MGVILNRRRGMGIVKEKVLFALYNTYFDGTVNSVINTAIKLWDGTHNKFKIEIEFDKITGTQSTLFTCKPDTSPYSGIRIRNTSDYLQFTISENIQIESREWASTNADSYGNHVNNPMSESVNAVTIIREDNHISIEHNNKLCNITINNPKTNNLNLMIGCDYRGANDIQRYYKGTIYKFVITELK